MENRLNLNRKPKYELPDETLIGRYVRGIEILNFEPDVCVSAYGTIGIREPEQTNTQIWIKSNNKELIKFIKEYDYNKLKISNISSFRLSLWKLKKIILEEFYGE